MRTSCMAYFQVHDLATASKVCLSFLYRSATSGSMQTSQKGSVRRDWIEISTFGIVSPDTQLACWIESMPTSPCLDTLGWKILVRNLTSGVFYLYLKVPFTYP